MLESIFTEGLIYGIMVLGVFITFRILHFPDLTVDGSFPLGGAVLSSMILAGHPPLLAMLVAFLAGALAGMVTAEIHNRLGVPNLLAGILTMTMLYSINLRIIGKANISLPARSTTTLLTQAQDFLRSLFPGLPQEWALLVYFIFITLLIKFLLDIFFRTDLGLIIGALGTNEQMVIAQGANPKTLKIIGVALSNGLVSVSGAFATQFQGFADIGMGTGRVVDGLAAVMIGEFFLSSNKITVLTFRVLIGSILFRGLYFVCRRYGYLIGMNASDLKLITGILIIICLLVSRHRGLLGKFGIKK